MVGEEEEEEQGILLKGSSVYVNLCTLFSLLPSALLCAAVLFLLPMLKC